MPFEQSDGLGAISGGEYTIAKFFQLGGNQFAQGLFILGHEDEFALSAWHRFAGFGCEFPSRFGGAWKKNFKRTSLAHFTFHPQEAGMSDHDAHHRGEADARAFAIAFGGEERLENLRLHFGGHSRAGIRNEDRNKFTGFTLGNR